MIMLTLLTKNDCVWCRDGKEVLQELAEKFPLQIEEINMEEGHGRLLAEEHHVMFAPGLLANGRLIAHGRLSKRALHRYLANAHVS